jgi:hypothetical protein
MVRLLSKAESLKRYFLTLPISDRADVLTVRDERAVEILRGMQDVEAEHGASSTLLFSLTGVAQRRDMKGFGAWVVSAKDAKTAPVGNPPTVTQLVPRRMPAELIMSQRIVDASLRLESQLRLDLLFTLSVPVRTLLLCLYHALPLPPHLPLPMLVWNPRVHR